MIKKGIFFLLFSSALQAGEVQPYGINLDSQDFRMPSTSTMNYEEKIYRRQAKEWDRKLESLQRREEDLERREKNIQNKEQNFRFPLNYEQRYYKMKDLKDAKKDRGRMKLCSIATIVPMGGLGALLKYSPVSSTGKWIGAGGLAFFFPIECYQIFRYFQAAETVRELKLELK